jgi:hypothetical protein
LVDGTGQFSDPHQPPQALTLPSPSRPRGTVTTIGFDYSILDRDLADDARTVAERIRGRLRTACVDTGRDLIGIKDRLGHGRFGAWLKAEFDMTERTAENCMNVARFLEGKSETLSVLPPTILYALAAPSAPLAVVNEVVNAAETGTIPAPKEIRQKLSKAKLAERLAEEAERKAKIEAAKSTEQRAKEQKARESKAQREARNAAEHQATKEKEQREEEERVDRLRPLADRIATLGGRDLRALVKALDDWNDTRTLMRLLREATTLKVAA